MRIDSLRYLGYYGLLAGEFGDVEDWVLGIGWKGRQVLMGG